VAKTWSPAVTVPINSPSEINAAPTMRSLISMQPKTHSCSRAGISAISSNQESCARKRSAARWFLIKAPVTCCIHPPVMAPTHGPSSSPCFQASKPRISVQICFCLA